jgi:hypothetical protein
MALRALIGNPGACTKRVTIADSVQARIDEIFPNPFCNGGLKAFDQLQPGRHSFLEECAQPAGRQTSLGMPSCFDALAPGWQGVAGSCRWNSPSGTIVANRKTAVTRLCTSSPGRSKSLYGLEVRIADLSTTPHEQVPETWQRPGSKDGSGASACALIHRKSVLGYAGANPTCVFSVIVGPIRK